MIDLGPHASYILASYAVTILVLGVIIGQSLAAYRHARRRVAALPEPEGPRRD